MILPDKKIECPGAETAKHGSFWYEAASEPLAFEVLNSAIETDIFVIGGGIAGPCPIHGSWFSSVGKVINGPATSDLKLIEVKAEEPVAG